MKKFLILCCVTLLFFAGAVQANECKIDDRTLKIGETYSQPGKCTEFKCTGPNTFFAKTCPEEQAPEDCVYHDQDNSKPYPQCCPRFEC